MLGKITKATVDKLQPGSLLWDQSLVGFGVRKQLRHPHYVVRYRHEGKQRLVTIGRHGAWTPETARRKAQELLGVVASGIDPNAPANGDSFGTILDRYLARKQTTLRPRSLVEVTRHLRQHALPLHSLKLEEIDRRQIAEVLASVEEGSGLSARNRVRASLSAFWHWLITEGLAETNPVQGTAKASEGRGRDRVLSPDEIRKVWAVAGDDDLGRIVKLLLLTGQRRNEIANLDWAEVNLTDNVIVFSPNRTKNAREHTLPLSNQALALLGSKGNGRVFANHGQQWSWDKAKLDARAGIGHWTLHDLRRTAVTCMNEIGVLPHVVEAVVNHVSGAKAGIAGRYNHSRLIEPMRDALQRWADKLDQITLTQ